jgi:hypothetical protein
LIRLYLLTRVGPEVNMIHTNLQNDNKTTKAGGGYDMSRMIGKECIRSAIVRNRATSELFSQ